MKLDVLHLHGFSPRGTTGALEHGLVVEAEAQLRHAGEVALHLDGAEDLAAQHAARAGDEQVEGLDDVEEDFIFAVADPLAAPGDGVGDGYGGPGLDFEFVGFLGDVSVPGVGR